MATKAMAISIQTQFSDTQSMVRPFHRLNPRKDNPSEITEDRRATVLVNGLCNDPSDYSTMT
jgi:hypothetical protein